MGGQVCDDDEEKSREMGANSSGGFCYSDNTGTIQAAQHQHLVNHLQIQGGGFVTETEAETETETETDPALFNLTTGIDMIGFSKTNTNNATMWKSLFISNKSSSSPAHEAAAAAAAAPAPSSSTTFVAYHHHQQQDFTPDTTSSSQNNHNNLMVAAAPHSSSSAPWQQDHTRLTVDDDSSNFRCVFPCEGNERPSQGLSLSLSSNNPSTIGLQSFELRHHHQILQDQPFLNNPPHKAAAAAANLYQGHFLLRNSKFLVPAQDLLSEFCSLGTRQQSEVVKHKNKQWEEEDSNGGGTASSKKHPLSSLEFVELQKRKTKLLAMLEEVERRYKHYCNQMRGVVSSFEAVAGEGAARVYSALALKAMSRHFRCLKDGIMEQIERTRKAMGEKDPVAPAGTSRGETPRLRVIDQALRQQRAFHQMTIIETHPWRPQRGLPERSVSLLRAWLFEHFLHPYPSDVDKHILARQTGLSRSQVSNWFINARVRLWKPMVEEMYLEEAKENENNMASSDGGTNTDDAHHQNLSPNSTRPEDQKPIQARLLRIDSECVSSIINNNSDHKCDSIKSTKTIHNMNPSSHDQQFLGRVAADVFGSVEIDFSSYDHHHSTAGMVSYSTNSSNDLDGNHHSGGFNNGGAVSLTLGLQQHAAGGNAVSLAFPPAATQGSMFYSREQIEECQPVVHQYSLLDGEGQSMPYRNLMGTQLLHDLAN